MQRTQPHHLCHVDILQASLHTLEALEKLKENIVKEHNIHMEFIIFMFKTVMGRLMTARAMIASYPYYPDPLAISNVLYEVR